MAEALVVGGVEGTYQGHRTVAGMVETTASVHNVAEMPDKSEASVESSDSSDRGSLPRNTWRCQDPSCRNQNDFKEKNCVKCGYTNTRFSTTGRYGSQRRGFRSRMKKHRLWISRVVSPTKFYALTVEGKKDADNYAQILSKWITDSSPPSNVFTGMICATETQNGWVRVRVMASCQKVHCTIRCQKDGDEGNSHQATCYWHVFMLDYGDEECVASKDLMSVTRTISNIAGKTQQYLLQGVVPDEDLDAATVEEGREWLQSMILNQWVDVRCFSRRRYSQAFAKVQIGDIDVNKGVVEKGYAKFLLKLQRKLQMSHKKEVNNIAVCLGEEELSLLYKSSSTEDEAMNPVTITSANPEQCVVPHSELVKDEKEIIADSFGEDFDILNAKHSKTLKDAFDVIQIRKEFQSVMDNNSVLNGAIQKLQRESCFDALCFKISEYGCKALTYPLENKASMFARAKFWREVMNLSKLQSIICRQILLLHLKKENIIEDRDQPAICYTKIFIKYVDWKERYAAAQIELDNVLKCTMRECTRFTSYLRDLAVGHKRPRRFTWDENFSLLNNALGYEASVALEGKGIAKTMVQAVEAGIENGISKLSAIHQLIDQVNNLTPMKMSDGCKADEGGTKEPLTLYELVTNSMQSIPPETLLPLVKDIVQDLARYHQKGETYNNLHPKNVVLIDGSAKLLPLKAAVAANSLKETSCSESEVQQDDIVTFADNIYSVGMLILWLSVQGNGNFESAEEVKLHIMPSIPKLLAEKPGDRPTIQEVEQLWFSNSDQTSLQENQMKRQKFSGQNVFPGKIEEDTPVGTVEKTSSDSALSDDLIVQHKTSATKEKYTESSDTVGFEMDEEFVLAMQIKAENVGITENEDLVSMQITEENFITENEGLVSAMQGSVDITENEDLVSMQITENEGLVSAISGAEKSVD